MVAILAVGCAREPLLEDGNTYDEEDRAILAFPTDDNGGDLPGFFAGLDGQKFRDPPPTVFVQPGARKVGYYCKSPNDVQYVTLELKPHRAYAFRCVDDRHAEVKMP